MEPILTLHQAARFLKLAPVTLYRKARLGMIPAARVGRIWRFHREELEEWIRGAGGEKVLPTSNDRRFRHLSTREVGGVVHLITTIRSRYRTRLEEVVLYGSRARGDFKALSDIDLLVVMRNPTPKMRGEILSLASRIGLEEEVPIQTLILSDEEWRDPSYRTFLLVERIRREGISLYG